MEMTGENLFDLQKEQLFFLIHSEYGRTINEVERMLSKI
jgi:hypothetical protein